METTEQRYVEAGDVAGFKTSYEERKLERGKKYKGAWTGLQNFL